MPRDRVLTFPLVTYGPNVLQNGGGSVTVRNRQTRAWWWVEERCNRGTAEREVVWEGCVAPAGISIARLWTDRLGWAGLDSVKGMRASSA